MDLNYSVEDKEGVKVISLDGNLSITNSEQFEHLVDGHTQKSSVILNLNEVRLITSSGMNSLVNVSIDAKNRNNRVLLMKPSDDFRRMVDILNAFESLILVDSIEEGQVKIRYYT